MTRITIRSGSGDICVRHSSRLVANGQNAIVFRELSYCRRSFSPRFCIAEHVGRIFGSSASDLIRRVGFSPGRSARCFRICISYTIVKPSGKRLHRYCRNYRRRLPICGGKCGRNENRSRASFAGRLRVKFLS